MLALCRSVSRFLVQAGAFQGICVYKVKFNRQEYLIAYRPPTDEQLVADSGEIELFFIDFYQIGTHENFYDELKKYLKA